MRSRPPARQSPPAQSPRDIGAAVAVGDDAAAIERQAGAGEDAVVELLADRLHDHVGGEHFLAGAIFHEAHRDHATIRVALDRDRRKVVVDRDAAGLRPVLLGGRRRQVLGAAPIDHAHVFRAEELALHGGVDGSHAAADDDDAPADRQRRRVARRTQLGDEVDRVAHAGEVLARNAEGVGARQAQREIDRVVVRAQRVELGAAVEVPAQLERDAADPEQPVDLRLGEVAGHLVASPDRIR